MGKTIRITHSHADGTELHGSTKGDGVYDLVRKRGFTARYGRIIIRPSRDMDAKMHIITPVVELLRAHGHEVELDIDNTARPTEVVEREKAERAAEKAERLGERSAKADAAGDAALAARRRITDGIPFGQPRQHPGHHSYARHTRDLERADQLDGKAVEQWRSAEHLAERASGVEANQQQRVNPRTTMRRIETLEAENRKYQRDLDGYERTFYKGDGKTVHFVEKHAPSVGGQRETLLKRIADNNEKIAYWRGELAKLGESGAFVPWGKEHFAKGDRVRRDGFPNWYPVTRVNAKSVSIINDFGYKGTIPWDEVAGRRRGDEQLDKPNGEPWPVELANRVAAWFSAARWLNGNDSSTEAVFKRIRLKQAQRIVLGLDLDAADAEVEVCMKAIDDPITERQVYASFFDVFTWLGEDGVKAADVKAQFEPIALQAAWRVPDREPVRRIANRDQVRPGHDDIIAIAPGDLAVGFYERNFGGDERLVKSFCGPVATVSGVIDRRERGDFVTVTLVDGRETTVKTHTWFAVHPAGTWEQPDDQDQAEPSAEADDVEQEQDVEDYTIGTTGHDGGLSVIAEVSHVDLTEPVDEQPVEAVHEHAEAREAIEAASARVDEAKRTLHDARLAAHGERIKAAHQVVWDAEVALRAALALHLGAELEVKVPHINSGIVHEFVGNTESSLDEDGQPVFCIPPCHGHRSMPFHLPATAPPAPVDEQPVGADVWGPVLDEYAAAVAGSGAR
ncbi:DUF3560 domain-containing protein [Actinoplanes sp. URMC 104]|uniref:DUF3560 domain-containing protein n=1 Tax=Actinoplanes sp. URMC 104 TaxID=3423409 RepID=UPI003F1C6F2C